MHANVATLHSYVTAWNNEKYLQLWEVIKDNWIHMLLCFNMLPQETTSQSQYVNLARYPFTNNFFSGWWATASLPPRCPIFGTRSGAYSVMSKHLPERTRSKGKTAPSEGTTTTVGNANGSFSCEEKYVSAIRHRRGEGGGDGAKYHMYQTLTRLA